MKQNNKQIYIIETRFRFQDILYFAVWFGILSVLVEISFFEIKELMGGATFYLHSHKIWMTPTVNITILVIVGLISMPVTLFLPRPMAIRIICFLFGSVSFLGILCLESRLTLSRIHFIPKLIFASGLAFAFQSLIESRILYFDRFVRRTSIGLVLFVLVLAAVFGGWQHFQEQRTMIILPDPPESAPNVLLVVLDTVRAKSMSLYGYERKTTPFLDVFAKEGVVFQNAIATSSWTLPTYASIYTGRFQYETEVNWLVPLDSTYPTLAEVLSRNGYATVGFMANTSYCNAERGVARGFALYEDQITLEGRLMKCSSLIRYILGKKWFRQLIGYHELIGRKRAGRITNNFLRWLDKAPNDRPFFASLNYYDAHQPYLPPKEFDGMFGSTEDLRKYLVRYMHRVRCSPENTSTEEIKALHNAYDAAIAYLDADLNRLFEELRLRNVLDRTLLILVSDHGEEFAEHSVIGHGTDLHIQSIHVPLFLRYPSSIPMGIMIQKPVSLRDIPATVIDILGLPDKDLFPGRSLSRCWTNDKRGEYEHNEFILSELIHAPSGAEWSPVSKGDMKSLVIGDMHYIRNGDGSEEIYDLRIDPFELNDLIETTQGTEVAECARQFLDQMMP